jgi:hypothetical protein
MLSIIPDVMWTEVIFPMVLNWVLWAYVIAIPIGYVYMVYISIKDGDGWLWSVLGTLEMAPFLPGMALVMGLIWAVCWMWQKFYVVLKWFGQKCRPVQILCTLIDWFGKFVALLARIIITLIALPVVLPFALLMGLLALASGGEREIHDA